MSAVLSAVGIPRPNHPNSGVLLSSLDSFICEEEQQQEPSQHHLHPATFPSSSVSSPTLLNTSSPFPGLSNSHPQLRSEKKSKSGGRTGVVTFHEETNLLSSPSRGQTLISLSERTSERDSLGNHRQGREEIHLKKNKSKSRGGRGGAGEEERRKDLSTWDSSTEEEEAKIAAGRCVEAGSGGGDSDCSTRSCKSVEVFLGVKHGGEEEEGRFVPRALLVSSQEVEVGGVRGKEEKVDRCVREEQKEKKKYLGVGKSSSGAKSSSGKEEEDRKASLSTQSLESRTPAVEEDKKEEGTKKKKKEKSSVDEEEILCGKLSAEDKEKQRTSSYEKSSSQKTTKNRSLESDLQLRHSSRAEGKIEKSSTPSPLTGKVQGESHHLSQPPKQKKEASTTRAFKSAESLVDVHSTIPPSGGGTSNHTKTVKGDSISSAEPRRSSSISKSRPYLSSSSSAVAVGEIGNSPLGKKSLRVCTSIEAKSPQSLKSKQGSPSYSASSHYSHTPGSVNSQQSSSTYHHSSLQQTKSSSHLSAKGLSASSSSVASTHGSPYLGGGVGGGGFVVVASQLSSSTLASSSSSSPGGGTGRTSSGGTVKGGSASSSSLASVMAPTVMNTPTRIESGRQRFLILDAPSHENLAAYIAEMKAFEVTDLVRTCEPTYDEAVVHAAGIQTHELIFPDGEAPPDDVIDEWLDLCDAVSQRKGAIAVHCVAGLGRAPVLVAIALIEKGMDPMDAIMFIRDRRK
ncbi:protein tyrosine phosphatase, partial [Cystoisospora suis]